MRLKANAKINLSLCIKGKRDDGYHFIDTVMHSVGIYDELELCKAETISVECDKYDIPQQDNLAYKAASLFFENFQIEGGVTIKIRKNIPAAAGLGGGSADAAAVLVGLNRLYNAEISNSNLEKLALKLGADVPFFITGGCKRAEGIGEIFTDIKPLETGAVLLAKAETKPSTAEMYRVVDSKEPIVCDTDAVIDAINQNDLKRLCANLSNSFETVWEQSFVKTALEKEAPLGVSLSGSGPTWFAVFENDICAKAAAVSLSNKNIECWVVTPQKTSIIFE